MPPPLLSTVIGLANVNVVVDDCKVGVRVVGTPVLGLSAVTSGDETVMMAFVYGPLGMLLATLTGRKTPELRVNSMVTGDDSTT